MNGSSGYCWDGEDVIVWLRVQPRASRDAWGELSAHRFRVWITAPPVEGQANSHLRKFLASLFGVAKSRVTLLAGETGREKRLRIASPKRLPPGVSRPPV